VLDLILVEQEQLLDEQNSSRRRLHLRARKLKHVIRNALSVQLYGLAAFEPPQDW